MKKITFPLSFVFVFLLIQFLLFDPVMATSTFSRIHNTLQSKCSNASCHNGATAAQGYIDFTQSAMMVYGALIDSMPQNAMARTKGYMLIDPGHAHRSFLLKKLIHALDTTQQSLGASEGDIMRDTAGVDLGKEEIELIRQWIFHGAPFTGLPVDTSVITRFYSGLGIKRIEQPVPPAPGEGFQLHFGPVLMAPKQEFEYYKKEDLGLTEDIEVTELDIKMNLESHHFILYKYLADSVDKFEEGLRPVDDLLDAADMTFSSIMVAIWQNERPHTLPEGAAYKWEAGTTVDLNVHMINPHANSVLASEVYVNVYTQPVGTAEQEMLSGIMYYLDEDTLPFFTIHNNAKDTTLTMHDYIPNSDETRHIWLFQGHTHQIGTGYDVWYRNPDGSQGEVFYKGTFNQMYQFDQGYYDWEHPPVRYFEPRLEPIKMSEGLIHKASYYNDGSKPIGFGLTTEDEMFAAYYQYTKAPLTTSINEQSREQANIGLYPNPSTGKLTVDVGRLGNNGSYTLEVFNLLGAKMLRLDDLSHRFQNIDLSDFSADVYLIKVTSGEEVFTSKVIKQ